MSFDTQVMEAIMAMKQDERYARISQSEIANMLLREALAKAERAAG